MQSGILSSPLLSNTKRKGTAASTAATSMRQQGKERSGFVNTNDFTVTTSTGKEGISQIVQHQINRQDHSGTCTKQGRKQRTQAFKANNLLFIHSLDSIIQSIQYEHKLVFTIMPIYTTPEKT